MTDAIVVKRIAKTFLQTINKLLTTFMPGRIVLCSILYEVYIDVLIWGMETGHFSFSPPVMELCII